MAARILGATVEEAEDINRHVVMRYIDNSVLHYFPDNLVDVDSP
jgi:hypothetical protein